MTLLKCLSQGVSNRMQEQEENNVLLEINEVKSLNEKTYAQQGKGMWRLNLLVLLSLISSNTLKFFCAFLI